MCHTATKWSAMKAWHTAPLEKKHLIVTAFSLLWSYLWMFCVTRWCRLCPGVVEYQRLKALLILCGTSLTGVRVVCSSTFSVVLSTWKMERCVTSHFLSPDCFYNISADFNDSWIIIAISFKLILYFASLWVIKVRYFLQIDCVKNSKWFLNITDSLGLTFSYVTALDDVKMDGSHCDGIVLEQQFYWTMHIYVALVHGYASHRH